MCPKHYRRWRAHGTTEPGPRKAAETQCSIEGCDGAGPIARGWCHKHYTHWHMYGDPLPPVKVRAACAVESCGRPSEARGWCQGHHVRWKKTGDVQADIPIRGRVPRTCSLPDCGEPYFAKGLCRLHYSRLQKTGTTDGPPRYGDRCSADDCDRPSWVKGFCQRCYMRTKSRQHREENPGYQAENKRKWRKVNPEKSREIVKRWNRAHPEKKRAIARKAAAVRRARQLIQAEVVDYEVILAEYGMACHICRGGIESRADLHMDHVIPLARGGTHTYDNIRPSHAVCNMSKGDRLMSELAA